MPSYHVYALSGGGDGRTELQFLGSFNTSVEAISYVGSYMKESIYNKMPVDFCHSEMTKKKPYVCLDNDLMIKDTCKKGHFGGIYIKYRKYKDSENCEVM